MMTTSTVTVTTDADERGFRIEVEPMKGGGWLAVEPGFHGFGPGQPTKVYVDGQAHWAQRNHNKIMLLPD